MDQEIESEVKIRWNWKVLILSIVVYYSVEIGLSFLLIAMESHMDRAYKLLIALVAAIYFYQTRKEKKNLKKDTIVVSIVGVIIAALLVLSHL